MNKIILKNEIDEKWLSEAEKNAEHRAKIFIDIGQHEKAALALKELSYKKSIIFLFQLGKKYFLHHDRRAETVVKTSELIEKKKIRSKEISLNVEKYPHGVHMPISKRHSVSEIFAS